jgi:hypothetical protein
VEQLFKEMVAITRVMIEKFATSRRTDRANFSIWITRAD